MNFLSVQKIAEKWEISERSVRNYCAERRVSGAVLVGKTWKIPADAKNPNVAEKGKETVLLCWSACGRSRPVGRQEVFTTKFR